MRLLLDTHIIVWWSEGSPRLGSRARDILEDKESRLFVSTASWWEIAIKKSLGRLRFDFGRTRDALDRLEVATLAITMSHAETAARLKRLHSDPFDHMLVAQATDEGLTLLTRDVRLKPYGSHVSCV